MIRLHNVSLRYANGFTALDNINLELPDGELQFLTGHSGAGKTSLLNLIARIQACTEGTIEVAGYALNELPKKNIPYFRRKIGMVFQNPHLILDQTAFENVAKPLEILGFTRRDIEKRVRTALDKVGLARHEKATPDTLSAGEKQRLALARAVVSKPELIIADEPTGNLDPELADDMFQLLRQFNDSGVSCLIATHDLSRIARLPYKINTLKNGRLLNKFSFSKAAADPSFGSGASS